MLRKVLFVSVKQSFRASFSLPELEPWVERAWAITVSKAANCDRVIAVLEGEPIAAWRIRGAFVTDETYKASDGTMRYRTGLSLGDPLPVLPTYRYGWICGGEPRDGLPALRRGVAVAERDLPPLPSERRLDAETQET